MHYTLKYIFIYSQSQITLFLQSFLSEASVSMAQNNAFRFKHLVSESMKEVWKNSKVSTQGYEANIIKVNQKYIAYLPDKVGGILNIFDMHKQTALSDSMPSLKGHEGSIQDLEFMPFTDNILATAGSDSKVKIWKIPEEINQDITQCESTLNGHAGKCTMLCFNQAAQGILASTAYDKIVCVWDIMKSSNLYSIQGSQKDYATCIDWNQNGSLLASTWKDKHLRMIDPRQKSIPIEALAHEGNKSAKVTWMGSYTDLVTTVGYNAQYMREIKLWDIKKIGQPVSTVKIDNLAGILYPFYDADLHIIYLAAKGESSIKYYEFINNSYSYFVNDYKSATQQKVTAFQPSPPTHARTHARTQAQAATSERRGKRRGAPSTRWAQLLPPLPPSLLCPAHQS